MDVQKEKEWLHRINGAQTSKKSDQETKKASSAKAETTMPMNKKAHSFKDVAGMDELKRLVLEGFINVLKNRECAEAFGIVPPSLLFYPELFIATKKEADFLVQSKKKC